MRVELFFFIADTRVYRNELSWNYKPPDYLHDDD